MRNLNVAMEPSSQLKTAICKHMNLQNYHKLKIDLLQFLNHFHRTFVKESFFFLTIMLFEVSLSVAYQYILQALHA